MRRPFRTILTDVDDTILECADALQAWMADLGHVTEQRLHDHYDIEGLYGLDRQTAMGLIRRFSESEAMGRLRAAPDALEVLPRLRKAGFKLVAITSCHDSACTINLRMANLASAFSLDWDAVHCLGIGADKLEVLRAYPPSIWVDDLTANAVAGAKAGHTTFLLDRLHNRVSVNSSVRRVADWHEIESDLCHIAFQERL